LIPRVAAPPTPRAYQSALRAAGITGRQIADLGVDRADGLVTNVATEPGGELVYVVQPAHGVLSVFNLRTTARAAVLHLPAPLGQIVPSPDSQFVLVPSGARSIAVVSSWTLRERARTVTNEPLSIIEIALFRSMMATISPPGREAVFLDLWKQRAAPRISLPGSASAGAIGPDGLKVYFALPDTGQVAVVNVYTGRIQHLIDNIGGGVSKIVPAVGNGFCH
jgi:DNA-binding beta-propeller fold protein YncE